MEPDNEQESDTDVSRKMEDEHLRLQRQVRMIAIDRLHRSMGVHPQFRQKDHLLRTLKKEYLNLHKDLKIAKSGAHKKKDRKMKAGLKLSLLLRTRTEQECEEGIILMSQLDNLLHRKNKYMLQLKQTVTANNGQLEERRLYGENRLASAGNRLEAAMRRFNSLQCENKKIREEIEHMLNDRALFNQSWNKMLNALKKGKKFLTDLFESSTLAYDQRDDWCAKLKSMQDKGKIDQMVQIQEMRDLQKAFDHQIKMYNFLSKKGVIRINKIQEERELNLKKERETIIWEEYRTYSKILEDIHDYTKEYDVKKIIEIFERVEQENFSLYILMTDFCAEREFLNRNLKQIHQDIVDRKEWNEKSEEKRLNNLKQLREELAKQKVITEQKRKLLNVKVQVLEEKMEKVVEIFKLINCPLDPYMNLLGEKQPSLNYLNLTFRLITDEIKELIEVAYYYERNLQKKGDKSSSRLKKYTIHPQLVQSFEAIPINVLVPTDPCPSCVEARWLSRVSDKPEVPFDKDMALLALSELENDPAFIRSDRIHPLTDCRVPRSRVILARRYVDY